MKNAEKIRPNEISEKTKASMKTRIIAGLVGLVIVVPPILGGDWFILVLSAVLLVISLFEIINVTKVNGRKYSAMIYVATILCGVAIAYWPIVLNIVSHFRSGEWGNHIYEYFTGLNISVPAIFICVCILFLTSVLHETFSIRDACYLIAMVLVASIGMQALLYVRYLPCWLNASERPFFNSFDTIQSSGLFAYAILGAFATDIGAYFTGIFFGKKKINERISPKKTYGGFVGGLVISAVVTAAFAFILAACKKPILAGYLDLEHWWNIVILSVVMPIMATLGDFVFSAIKRFYDIKDFGKIIPGHGGILDRLDSIYFTFLTVAVYLSIYIYLIVGSTAVGA